jgi:hypothetical protein
MKKTFAIIATSLAILSAAQANTLLSNLGSLETTIFSDGTNLAYTLNSSSTTLSSITDNAGSSITWAFNTPITLASINSQNLFLNFSLSGTNPNSSFHVDLYDSAGGYYTFTGTTTSASSTTSDIALTFATYSPGEVLSSSFLATALVFDGTGSPIQGMTVSNLNYSAVPEPSTYALLAIAGLGLFFAARRRKVQA